MKRGLLGILIATGIAAYLVLIAVLAVWAWPSPTSKLVEKVGSFITKISPAEKNQKAKKTPAKSKWSKVDLKKLKSDITAYLADKEGQVGVFLKLDDGSTMEFNGNLKSPSASLIKVPIAVAVYDEINRGKLKLKDELVVPKVNPNFGGQVLPGGSRAEVGDLINYMLSQSDNASANALIDKVGMSKVNKIIASSGAKGTTLKRKMLDFNAIDAGVDNFTTPADMVLFLEKLDRHKLLTPKYCDAIISDMAANADKEMIASLQGANVVHGSGAMDYPDGFTVSDTGIVKTGKGTFFLAVLTKGQPSEKDGLTTVTDIARKVKETLDK